MPPTATDLTTRFPAFVGVPSPALNAALAEAATRVDGTWTKGDYPLGIMLYAAHLLTLDGLGTGAEAAMAAAAALGFQSMQSGSPQLTRERGREGKSVLDETTYGRRFAALLKVNQPAVLLP